MPKTMQQDAEILRGAGIGRVSSPLQKAMFYKVVLREGESAGQNYENYVGIEPLFSNEEMEREMTEEETQRKLSMLQNNELLVAFNEKGELAVFSDGPDGLVWMNRERNWIQKVVDWICDHIFLTAEERAVKTVATDVATALRTTMNILENAQKTNMPSESLQGEMELSETDRQSQLLQAQLLQAEVCDKTRVAAKLIGPLIHPDVAEQDKETKLEWLHVLDIVSGGRETSEAKYFPVGASFKSPQEEMQQNFYKIFGPEPMDPSKGGKVVPLGSLDTDKEFYTTGRYQVPERDGSKIGREWASLVYGACFTSAVHFNTEDLAQLSEEQKEHVSIAYGNGDNAMIYEMMVNAELLPNNVRSGGGNARNGWIVNKLESAKKAAEDAWQKYAEGNPEPARELIKTGLKWGVGSTQDSSYISMNSEIYALPLRATLECLQKHPELLSPGDQELERLIIEAKGAVNIAELRVRSEKAREMLQNGASMDQGTKEELAIQAMMGEYFATMQQKHIDETVVARTNERFQAYVDWLESPQNEVSPEEKRRREIDLSLKMYEDRITQKNTPYMEFMGREPERTCREMESVLKKTKLYEKIINDPGILKDMEVRSIREQLMVEVPKAVKKTIEENRKSPEKRKENKMGEIAKKQRVIKQ